MEKDVQCHSEFISESRRINLLNKAEILNQVQDDICDTVINSDKFLSTL